MVVTVGTGEALIKPSAVLMGNLSERYDFSTADTTSFGDSILVFNEKDIKE